MSREYLKQCQAQNRPSMDEFNTQILTNQKTVQLVNSSLSYSKIGVFQNNSTEILSFIFILFLLTFLRICIPQ